MTNETHSAALPEWPRKPCTAVNSTHVEDLSAVWNYERARAEAYKCRLELAVEALEQAKSDIREGRYEGDTISDIDMALAAIGDLP